MRLAVPREERLLIKDNEAHRAAEHEKDLAQRKAALAKVDLFGSLSEDERLELAEHLVYAPFVKGDTVTRQGAVAHWLYLIVSGYGDVWVDTPAGRTHVSTLTPGNVFGEMGMMTGEPRRATITDELAPDEMTGGTFTVSNLGGLGVHWFTPVLNPPQSCVLGVGAVHTPHPEATPLLPLSLTFDHRALDGGPAAALLADIASCIETVDVLSAL